MIAWFVAVVGVLASGSASAEPIWHGGLNLRGDFGAHPIRASGGVEIGQVDLAVVLDPMFWTDGQVDTDVIADWRPCAHGWGGFAGFRTSSIGLLGGRQYQEKFLLGLSAPLPRLWRLRTRWSFELATVVVKHGGGLPTDWISFATGRDFTDLVNLGMFVTIEYAGAP